MLTFTEKLGCSSVSVSFGFGLQPLLLGGDFRLHFCYHSCQQFFAFLLAVSVDVAGMLFTIRPDWGVPPLPELFVDLGDTARARLAPLPLMGLEGAGGGFSGAAPVAISGSALPMPWSIFIAAVRRISSVTWA